MAVLLFTNTYTNTNPIVAPETDNKNFMAKGMALYIIIGSTLCLVFGILMLGHETGGIKYIHWIAILAVLIGIVTLQKEINSSLKTDSIKRTVEATQKTSDEINANVTGGDSYCYLNFEVLFQIPKDGKPLARMYLKNNGRYPLYNLKACILNATSFTDKATGKTIIPGILTNYIDNIDFEDLGPNQERPYDKFQQLSGNEVLLCLGFSSRNGDWYQRILFRKDDTSNAELMGGKVYYYHSVVYTLIDEPGKRGKDKIRILKEFHSNGAEAAINGPPDWDKYSVHYGCNFLGLL